MKKLNENFMLLETVENLPVNNMYNVVLHDDYLEIKNLLGKFTLKYDQITDVFYGLQTEITEKSKSVIGRAVAGGLLFGGAGAVLGAISGLGNKEKKIQKYMFIISYDENKFITFEDTRKYKGVDVAKKLKELCNIA